MCAYGFWSLKHNKCINNFALKNLNNEILTGSRGNVCAFLRRFFLFTCNCERFLFQVYYYHQQLLIEIISHVTDNYDDLQCISIFILDATFR